MLRYEPFEFLISSPCQVSLRIFFYGIKMPLKVDHVVPSIFAEKIEQIEFDISEFVQKEIEYIPENFGKVHDELFNTEDTSKKDTTQSYNCVIL